MLIGTCMLDERSVAICCSTFHRHEGLRALLKSLSALELREPVPEISIIITNNDPSDLVPATIAKETQKETNFEIVYLDESRRGLSFPRNRALDYATPKFDFIAFIDDDSTADPQWLQALLDAQQETTGDVITGPVLPNYEIEPPDWIQKGGFFAPVQRPNKSMLKRAYTNNILIQSQFLRDTQIRFNPDFALVGGEDTLFSRQMAQQGARIFWASNALVHDDVPAARITESWLKMRHKRTGMASGAMEKLLHPTPLIYLFILAKTVIWLALGILLYATGIILGKATRIKAQCWMAWGRGLTLGLFGKGYEEYLHER